MHKDNRLKQNAESPVGTGRFFMDNIVESNESSPSAMFLMSLDDFTYYDVNDSFCRIMGLEREDIIGRKRSDLGIQVDESYIKQLENLASGINPHNVFITYSLPSKDQRFGITSLEHVIIDGRPYLLQVVHDITALRNAEHALQLSEERYRRVVEDQTELVCRFLPNGRLIFVNQAYCRFFGKTREELLNSSFIPLIPEEDQKIVSDAYLSINMDNPVITYEHRVINSSGEVRWTQWTDRGIFQNGELIELQSVGRDITDSRNLAQHITRLSHLNLVGEVAASIGHEIRNPMTTVRGLLQLLGEKEEYKADKHFFDLMIEELDRGNAILSEFLSLAKNKHVELKPGNLNAIVRSISPLIQAGALNQDKTINIILERLPEILVDDKEIRQLILNLCHNGLEAMNAGGTLTIQTLSSADAVILKIKDEGHGIEPEYLDKLGMPFFTTKDLGTGLGLSICFGIAERHNAAISFESDTNGTCVTVSFPIF